MRLEGAPQPVTADTTSPRTRAAGAALWTMRLDRASAVPLSRQLAAALPRNPTGKILKRELREQYWQGEARQVR